MFLTIPIISFLDNAPVADSVIEVERFVIGYILNWLRLIAAGIAIILLTYMSFRYMTAVDPREKAELKKSLITYLIGAVILVGATNIIYFVEQLIEYILIDFIA